MNRQLIEGILKIGLNTAGGLLGAGPAGVLLSLGGQITKLVIDKIQEQGGQALDDLTQAQMEAAVAALVWKSPEELEKEGLGGK